MTTQRHSAGEADEFEPPTIRDYFTYYVAGIAWLVLGACVFLSESAIGTLEGELKNHKTLADLTATPITAALLVAAPFLVGFALSGVGMGATWLLLKIAGDPRTLAIDANDPHAQGLVRRMFRRRKFPEIGDFAFRRVVHNLAVTDRPDRETIARYFFLIKNFVDNSSLPSAGQANRNHLLANLAESLIVPVPVTILALGLRLSGADGSRWYWWAAAALSLWFLCRQYVYSREYEAKHIYWTFATSGDGIVRKASGVSSAPTEHGVHKAGWLMKLCLRLFGRADAAKHATMTPGGEPDKVKASDSRNTTRQSDR